jgi:hypothetical protein
LETATEAILNTLPNHATPRAEALILEKLLRGSLGAPEDSARLLSLLRNAPTLRAGETLEINFIAAGVDTSAPRRVGSQAIVDTGKGTVVLSVHAEGYADPKTAAGFLPVMARAIVRRLVPGAMVREGPATLMVRGLDQAVLLEAGQLQGIEAESGKPPPADLARTAATARSTFRSGETPALLVAGNFDQERVLNVRWTAPDGTARTMRRTVPPGPVVATSIPGSPPGPGTGRVVAALSGEVILRQTFQVLPAR